MTDSGGRSRYPRRWLTVITIGVAGGLVSGLVCSGVMRLLGADPDPAVVAGVAGAVSGGLMPLILRRRSGGRAD